MNPTDVIMKKRMGGELTREEIECFVRGAVDHSFADYQLSALLMAICIRGMSDRETVDLTMAMADSGDRLDLSGIPGVKADKHSTGGVGDTTTLVVAPLAASCGVKIAKMSGRGLGFTGGTLDKLESIPGFCVSMSEKQFIDQVTQCGIAVIGQTADLAPADKTLYALRDVTSTVDCLPLIVSSILSKKIAAGCDAVTLDVKTGAGALMTTLEASRELAQTMVRIGSMTGRKFSALVTDMEQPLGMQIGNALEVEEAIWILSGRCGGALLDVSLALGAQILQDCGIADTMDAAMRMLREKLESGAGLEKLGDLIEAQGGDRRIIRDPSLLPHAKHTFELRAEKDGYVTGVDARGVGNAARRMGAGRLLASDSIDPATGVVLRHRLGDFVKKGDPLMVVHEGAAGCPRDARALLESVYTISEEPTALRPLVHEIIA